MNMSPVGRSVFSRRKLLTTTVASLGAAAFAPLASACSSGGSNADTGSGGKNTGSSNSTGSTSNTGSISTVADASGAVDFWSQLAGSKQKAGEALDGAFEKANAGVKLNVNLLGDEEQMNQKLITSFAGGTAPDVFCQNWSYTMAYAAKGQLLELDSYMASHGLKASDLDARALAYGQVDGKTYSLPLYATSTMIGVNVKVATAAGLDTNTPPANWDDLRQWAVKMTKRSGARLDVAGWELPDQASNAFDNFLLALQGAGGSLLSEDLKTVTFNSDEGVEALTYLVDLMLKDKVCDPGFLDASTSQGDPFISGHAGLTTTENWEINLAATGGADVDFIPFPGKTGGATAISNPFCFAIPKGAKNPDAAFELINFAMSLDQQVLFATASKNLPALLAAQTDSRMKDYPKLTEFIKGGAFAPAHPPAIPAYTEISTAVAREIQSAMYGKSSPKEALDAAASAAKSALAA